MIDGDGCFSPMKNTNCIMFSLCGINNVILEKINDELSKNCGFQKNVVKKLISNCYNFTYWRNNDIEKITHYLYDNATLFLERKRNIVLKYLN
jgi:hypothetical protein